MRVRGALVPFVAFGVCVCVPASGQVVVVGTPARMGSADGDGPRHATDLIARGGGTGADAIPAGGAFVTRVNGESRAVRHPIGGGTTGAGVVLSDGLSDRVIVVVRDPDPHLGGRFNRGLPVAVYTDDGELWEPINGLDPVRLGNEQIEATTTAAGGAGDTPYWVDRRNHAPSVAVDRAQSPNHVYVAFCARSAQGSTNTDIYIHRSRDRGASFDATDLLQLTDALFGVDSGDEGVDQFVPAIAVDTCGGVNVMFYDNRHDGNREDNEEWVDVYYARIMGFGTATPTVQQWRLTPQSIRVDDLPASGFLGDYHNLAVSSDGKTIYAAYIGRDANGGERTCYLHRININCIGFASDFTGDEKVDGADLTAFMAAAAAKDPSADLNLDWSVDDQDVTLFLKWYDAEKGK